MQKLKNNKFRISNLKKYNNIKTTSVGQGRDMKKNNFCICQGFGGLETIFFYYRIYLILVYKVDKSVKHVNFLYKLYKYKLCFKTLRSFHKKKHRQKKRDY